MDKDKVKGTIDDAIGRAKRQVGEWTDDPEKQVEGGAQQIKGKVEKISGNVKDAVRDAVRKADERDRTDDDDTDDRNMDERNKQRVTPAPTNRLKGIVVRY
jgi:uncharacterized protein YjbJ (UPF0337 family)